MYLVIFINQYNLKSYMFYDMPSGRNGKSFLKAKKRHSSEDVLSIWSRGRNNTEEKLPEVKRNSLTKAS